MALNAPDLDRLLTLRDRPALNQAVQRLAGPLTLADLQPVVAHAAGLMPAPLPLRLAVVHTYTSELLQGWLDAAAALHGLSLQTYHAPYGVVLGEAQAGSPLVAHQPEMTLLMLQRADLHPALAQPVAGLAPDAAAALQQLALEHLQSLVMRFRALPVGQLVLTLLPAQAGPALGLHDAQADSGEAAFWRQLQTRLGQWLRESVPSSTWLDLDELVSEVGRRRAFDARYWLTARYPFTSEASLELARRLMSLGQLLKTPRAKVLVLDADNTLWGGVIGEDGMDGIALGPDFPGNAFVAFQRRILDLQQRGFVLAMCSKNNAADVDQVLQNHPHQLLKAEHFVARRVNWEPKPDNLVSLAAELNLGLDSFVFVDDSDHECAAVRVRLPQVEVVQVPRRPHEVPSCLDRIARLEVLNLTAEDRAKTGLYEAERKRQALLDNAGATAGDLAAHLVQLGMQMQIRLDARRHVPRLAQLTQKTNQFNLTTRRFDEQQIAAMIDAPDWLVVDFSLADVFGDAGIVGLALIRLCGQGEAELDSFLMSCRVIGRCAEDAFMHGLLRELQRRGVNRLRASYRPTPKNVLVQDLLPRLGFERDAGDVEHQYTRDLTRQPPSAVDAFPISVEWVAPATS
jgi:FkbH-like protein